MYYSPSLGGFYCEEINGEFMPVDCVPISDELYESLMAGSQAGMAIVSDEKEIARCVTQEEARRLRETAQPTALQKSVEEIEALRQEAYRKEADPLFFKAQRGKATMEEWKAKIAEIKKRYPSPIPGADDEVTEDAPPEDDAQAHEETSAQNDADAAGAAGTVDAAGADDSPHAVPELTAAPIVDAGSESTVEAPKQPAADQGERTASGADRTEDPGNGTGSAPTEEPAPAEDSAPQAAPGAETEPAPETEPVAEASPPAEPETEMQATDESAAEVELTVGHEVTREEQPEPTPPIEAPATVTDDANADAPIAGQGAAASPATKATPPHEAAGAEDATDDQRPEGEATNAETAGQDAAPKPGEPAAR